MNDIEASCNALERTGTALVLALTYQCKIIALSDGFPAKGDSAGRSSDATSSTERAALARADDDTHRPHEAGKARHAVEDIRDWWNGLRIYLADGARLAAVNLPPQERHAVLLCDGRPFEGSELPWTPNSRNHDNGWHDPLCVDVADQSGLCVRCKVRERRWREEHGKPPRNRNRIEEAA